MGRSASFSNVTVLNAVDPTTNPVTNAISLLGVAKLSISVKVSSGTVAGSIQIQATDFGMGVADQPPVTADWTNEGAAVPFTSPTTRIPLPNICGKFMRLVWTDSGSTAATITAAVTGTYYVDD